MVLPKRCLYRYESPSCAALTIPVLAILTFLHSLRALPSLRDPLSIRPVAIDMLAQLKQISLPCWIVRTDQLIQHKLSLLTLENLQRVDPPLLQYECLGPHSELESFFDAVRDCPYNQFRSKKLNRDLMTHAERVQHTFKVTNLVSRAERLKKNPSVSCTPRSSSKESDWRSGIEGLVFEALDKTITW